MPLTKEQRTRKDSLVASIRAQRAELDERNRGRIPSRRLDVGPVDALLLAVDDHLVALEGLLREIGDEFEQGAHANRIGMVSFHEDSIDDFYSRIATLLTDSHSVAASDDAK